MIVANNGECAVAAELQSTIGKDAPFLTFAIDGVLAIDDEVQVSTRVDKLRIFIIFF